MQQTLTEDDFKSLVHHKAPHSLTLTMTAHAAGRDTREDGIRFKNLLSQAEKHLGEAGMRGPEAHNYLAPLYELRDSKDFWRHQQAGLALFFDGEARTFRVPIPLEEMAYVGDRFYVKPLVPLRTRAGRFFILAISQQDTALYEATRHAWRKMNVPDMPDSIQELTRVVEPQYHQQWHTETPGVKGEERPAMFHGHGEGTDKTQEKKRIREYLEKVDNAVCRALADEGHEPLVLAAADPLIGMYRKANHYRHLADEAIHGNIDLSNPDVLQQQALEVVEPVFEKGVREAVEKYGNLSGSDLVTDRLEDVVVAAYDKRIDTLLVALDTDRWGRLDPESRKVELHDDWQPNDDELLNLAAVEALVGDASVYAVQQERMPTNAPVAATFRYATRG